MPSEIAKKKKSTEGRKPLQRPIYPLVFVVEKRRRIVAPKKKKLPMEDVRW